MADKVTISFAFDDKITPRLDVIKTRIIEIDKALQKARNFKVNTRSVSTSLDRVNGRLGRVLKNLDEIKSKKLFIDTRNTNQKLTGVNTRLNNISTKLGNALGTVKINTGTAQRSLNTMLTKVETIQNALGKTQLNPSKVASPTGAKSGRAAGRDAFAKLRGAFKRTRDPILQVNKALVQFRKEFRAAAKITKGFPGLRTAIKDFKRFEDAIKKIQKANFKNASKSFQGFAQKVKAATKPLTEFVASIKTASRVAKDLEASLKKSVDILRRISTALAIAARANKNFGKIEKSSSRISKGFAAIGRRVPVLNKFFGGPKLPLFIDRLRKLRFALVDVRNILKAVGLGAFFNQIKQGIADAANFELLTAQISTLIQGLGPGGAGTVITGGLGARFDFTDTAQGLDGALTALNRLVRDKAVEAGQDIEKTFKAAYDSISSGVPIESLEKFLDQASKLAVGGVTDISKATKLLLSVFQTTGRDIDKLEDQTDSLFTLVRLGRTTVDELSGSLGRVLPIAEAAGVSIDEVGGAISALSAGGLTTAEAVTALRQVLNKIINPSVASAKLARRLGIELNTAAIKSKGLKGVLEDIALATNSNTDVIGNLFPRVRALVGVLSLLRGEGTQTLDDFFDPFEDKAGATETAFSRLSDTLIVTVNKLKSAFSSLRAELFEGLIPSLTNTAERLRALFVSVFEPLRDASDFAGRVTDQIDTRLSVGPIQPEVAARLSAARGAIAAARDTQLGSIFNQFLSELANVFGQFAKLIGDSISIAIRVAVATLISPKSELGNSIVELFETVLDSFKLVGNGLINTFATVFDRFIAGFVKEALAIVGLDSPTRGRVVPSAALFAAEASAVGSGVTDDRLFEITERLAESLIKSINAGTIDADDQVVTQFVDALRAAGGGQGANIIGQLRDLPQRQNVFGGAAGFGGRPTLLKAKDVDAVERLRNSFFAENGLVTVLSGLNEQAVIDLKEFDGRRAEISEKQLAALDQEQKDLRENFELTSNFGGIKVPTLLQILGLEEGGPAGIAKEFRKNFPISDQLQELLVSLIDGAGEAVEEAKKDPGVNQAAKDSLAKVAGEAFEFIALQQVGFGTGGAGGFTGQIQSVLDLADRGIDKRTKSVLSGTGGIEDISGVRTLVTLIEALPTVVKSLNDLPDIGGDVVLQKFEKNLKIILEELPAIAAGGQVGQNFRDALSAFRSVTAEATQLKIVTEEELTTRRLIAANATKTVEQIKFQVAKERELDTLREGGIDETNALFVATQAILDLEEKRLDVNRKLASIQSFAAGQASIFAEGLLGRRLQGRGTRVPRRQAIRSQQSSLRDQRLILEDQFIDQVSEGATEADLLATSAQIAGIDQQIAELEEAALRLTNGVESFQLGLSDFFDSIPTRAEIALQTVTDFATSTADFFANTIANGIKILVQDGFGSFKDAVKDLDETLGRFFGQLLIDLGTAIVKAVLLRTIMSAIGGPLGGLFFNTGGPVPRMGFNSGGTVGGPPSANRDVVPAMLTPGEFVVRREAAQSVGTRFLMGLNSLGGPSSRFARSAASPRIGGVRGFNMGGPVAAGAGSAGGAQPTYLLSNEQNAQSFLQGGENAFISFLRENRNKF